MSENSNKAFTGHIADKLFYWIVIMLVLVLGVLGSIIIHQRIEDVEHKIEKRVDTYSSYLEQVLPPSIYRLDAKRIRQDMENVAGDELQAVEIFDLDGERIYVYERSGTNHAYDKKVERDMIYGGRPIGKMAAYFSMGSVLQTMRIREFSRLAVLIFAAGSVLAAGIYFLVKKTVVKPIGSALSFSEDLAMGNYNRRIGVTSSDEMGMLQESLNKMADAMQDAMEDLKASFYEAEGSRQQALEAARLKSEFLASMSHEIRTPVNAIVGFADILLEDEKDMERRENLKTIKNSANILLENITDILDLSKIEAGKIKLAAVEFSLLDLINEIAPIVRLRLHGKEVTLTSNIEESLNRPLMGDIVRIRQVLMNILINAAKFTYKGSIRLHASQDNAEHGILFKISDTGVGIPKEHHERIFEPFAQVDGSLSREHSGVGLGLAIAKRLVEMMNGRIWLESDSGKGSTFYFTVPIA